MSEVDPLWAQILVWTANTIGIAYNIPQIIHTVKRKKVDDISTISIVLRLTCSIMWVFYCLYFQLWGVGVTWFITLLSSFIIVYYKYLKFTYNNSEDFV